MDEQQVKEIVRRETEHFEKRIEQFERDLLLTKQHTTQAVQLMADQFSRELNNLLEKYEEAYLKASLSVIQGNK